MSVSASECVRVYDTGYCWQCVDGGTNNDSTLARTSSIFEVALHNMSIRGGVEQGWSRPISVLKPLRGVPPQPDVRRPFLDGCGGTRCASTQSEQSRCPAGGRGGGGGGEGGSRVPCVYYFCHEDSREMEAWITAVGYT